MGARFRESESKEGRCVVDAAGARKRSCRIGIAESAEVLTFDRSTSHTRAPSSPVHVRSCNHQLRHFFGPSPAELTTTTNNPRSATSPPSIAQFSCYIASLISKRCSHNSPRGFSYLQLSSTTSHTSAHHGHPLPSHAYLRRANNAN